MIKSKTLLEEIRITKDLHRFVRIDNFCSIAPKAEELIKLPYIQSWCLLAKGYAANGKCAHSDPCVFAFGREDCQGCLCDLTVFPHAYPWAKLKGMTKISDFVDGAHG